MFRFCISYANVCCLYFVYCNYFTTLTFYSFICSNIAYLLLTSALTLPIPSFSSLSSYSSPLFPTPILPLISLKLSSNLNLSPTSISILLIFYITVYISLLMCCILDYGTCVCFFNYYYYSRFCSLLYYSFRVCMCSGMGCVGVG